MRLSFQSFYKNNVEAIDTKWLRFTSIQFNWILTQLKEKYKPTDSFSVIDLGCGTGRLLSLIHKSFPNATLHGVDGTKEMINKAISRLPQNTNIKIMNLNNEAFTRKYDVILSTTVLHHLNNPKDHLLMIRSSLTSKGTAYISEFAIESISLWFANLWWSITHPAHKKTWTIKKFTNLLKQSSFKITNSKILKPDKFWILQIYELQVKKKTA